VNGHLRRAIRHTLETQRVDPRPDRNFWCLVGDAGLFSLAAVCFEPTVVLSVFVAQLTSWPILIGAPAALRIAGLYLPQLPVALGIRHFSHVQSFFFWQALVGRAALIGCAVAAFLATRIPPELTLGIVFVAWFVFTFTEGAATLAWLDLIGDVIDPRLRGRYFGIVQVLGGVMALMAGLGVSAALAGSLEPRTFASLFAWGFVGFMFSVVCIGLVRERRDTPRPPPVESSLAQVRKLVGGKHLLRLTVAQILAASLQIALPFYALFGREQLGLGGEWIGSFIVAQTLGGSAAALAWAPLAERYGARLVICLSAGLLAVIPWLPMLAQHVGGVALLATFVLAGAARGGSQAGFWQYILDLVPARDRRVFMGLANTANAPAVLGGVLLEWGGYSWMFVASIVLGIAATLSGLWLAPTSHTTSA
jgi:predicted MFS family arabinose efflux permease